MCTRPGCHNMEVFVKDYAKHLAEWHDMVIDIVQDRLMKSSAMHFRKGKYVWAPFPYEITQTLYDKHMDEILDEQYHVVKKPPPPSLPF